MRLAPTLLGLTEQCCVSSCAGACCLDIGSCSAVLGMGAGLPFALIVTINVLLPMCLKLLDGTSLCVNLCAHFGTYFKFTTILYFLYALSIYLF